MAEEPTIIDAEFQVVTEPPEPVSVPLLIATIISGVGVVAASIYFGGQTTGHGQTLFVAMGGAGFAAAIRAAFKLIATLSEQRRAAEGRARPQAEKPTADSRNRLR